MHIWRGRWRGLPLLRWRSALLDTKRGMGYAARMKLFHAAALFALALLLGCRSDTSVAPSTANATVAAPQSATRVTAEHPPAPDRLVKSPFTLPTEGNFCMGMPPDCTMHGGCCAGKWGIFPGICVDQNCENGGTVQPIPPVQPAPVFPSVPPGFTIPDVPVTASAVTVARRFNGTGYRGVIPAALIFRTGRWVASSTDGVYGTLTYGASGPVLVHVSVPTVWNGTNSLTVCHRNAHVTSTYAGSQVCRVYTNNDCTCNGANWAICWGDGAPIRAAMKLDAMRASAATQNVYRAIPSITVTADGPGCLQR